MTAKPTGGVYGYPAVLLLCCVVDALSNYAGHPQNSLGELQSILSVTSKQVKDFKNWYRNLLAHQAIIMPGTQLSPESIGGVIEFGSTGEPTIIRVIPFYQAVKTWWNGFDKASIKPKFQQEQAPKAAAVNTSGYFMTSHLLRDEYPTDYGPSSPVKKPLK